MCCNRGNGFYQLTNSSGAVLANGSQFVSAKVSPFCVSAAAAPLSLQLTAVQSVRCKGGQDGSISVQASGGSGSYNYTWDTGAIGPVLSNIPSGTYTVVVSDGINQAQLSVMVTEPPVPFIVSLSATPTTCNNATPTGTIATSISGGVAPYTYQWSNEATNAALTGLASGGYTVTVTDSNGCITIGAASVQQTSPLELQLFPEAVSCHGGNDGVIFTMVSGGALPYQFIWSTGSTNGWIDDLSAGAYGLTVTDATGCLVQQSAGVAQPQPLTPHATASPATNGANGSIYLEINGGTAPYTFLWSNGATTQHLTGLPAGTYTVIVTDAQGCTGFASATIVPGQVPGLPYCTARGSNTNFEWIERIQIGAYLNISGNNGGYGDFSASAPIPLTAGTTYPIFLTPGFQNNPFNESWRIWLDLNQDGDFLDAGELLFQPGLTNLPISSNLLIPANAAPGLTRMRIAMKYGSPASPCGVFAYGEVEDYAIFVSSNSGNLSTPLGTGGIAQARAQQPEGITDFQIESPALEVANFDFSLFPNPAASYVVCQYAGEFKGNGKLSVFDRYGRLVKTQIVNFDAGDRSWELSLDGLVNGYYRVQLASTTCTLSKSLVIIGQ